MNLNSESRRDSPLTYIVAGLLSLVGIIVAFYPPVPEQWLDYRRLLAGALVGAGVTLLFQELTEASARQELMTKIVALTSDLGQLRRNAVSINRLHPNDKCVSFGMMLVMCRSIESFNERTFVILGKALELEAQAYEALRLREIKADPNAERPPDEAWQRIVDDCVDIAEALYSSRARSALWLGHNIMSFGYEFRFLEPARLVRNLPFIDEMRKQFKRCKIEPPFAQWILENFWLCFNGRVGSEDAYAFSKACLVLLQNNWMIHTDADYRSAALDLITTFPKVEGMHFAVLSETFVARLDIFHGLADRSKQV